MINMQTAAALAFVAALSVNACYAQSEQASKAAPAPIASQPAVEDVKIAPQVTPAVAKTVESKTAEQQPQPQQSK